MRQLCTIPCSSRYSVFSRKMVALVSKCAYVCVTCDVSVTLWIIEKRKTCWLCDKRINKNLLLLWKYLKSEVLCCSLKSNKHVVNTVIAIAIVMYRYSIICALYWFTAGQEFDKNIPTLLIGLLFSTKQLDNIGLFTHYCWCFLLLAFIEITFIRKLPVISAEKNTQEKHFNNKRNSTHRTK